MGDAGARSVVWRFDGVHRPVSKMVPFLTHLLATPCVASFRTNEVPNCHLVIHNPEKPWEKSRLTQRFSRLGGLRFRIAWLKHSVHLVDLDESVRISILEAVLC